jgi:tubulin beta
VVEPYNEVLAYNKLIQNATLVVPIDNYVLMRLYTGESNREYSYKLVNEIISKSISNITASFRFPCHLNSSMRKMATNLVSFPRLKFCSVSVAPFDETKLSCHNLVSNLFSEKHSLLGLDLKRGRFFSSFVSIRGFISPVEIDHEIKLIKSKHSFIDFIPDSFLYSLNTHSSTSGTLLANSTAIQLKLQQQLSRFDKMFKRKAFLHYYIEEGMELDDFKESALNIQDLVNEYQQVHNSEVEKFSEEEEEQDTDAYAERQLETSFQLPDEMETF